MVFYKNVDAYHKYAVWIYTPLDSGRGYLGGLETT